MSLREEVFAKTSLFSSLTPEEASALASVAVEKSYGAGETLFHEGEPCLGLFVIGEGAVKIVKTTPSGRQIMLAVETAPSSVAEVPLFDGGNYPATVTAIKDTKAFLLLKQDFHRLCRANPDVSMKVLAVVGRRLRQLVGLLEGVTFGSVRQRLARALMEFGDAAARPSFPLPVTHEELAFRLGTVREVVSRNLSRFQAEGLLRIQRREIEILDRTGLQAEAETEL
jgi:CRP-like cAMP-binding protein